MSQHYLMTLLREADGMEVEQHFVIEASGPQMAKYHYHRTMKEMGLTDTQFGKHCLEGMRHTFTTLTDVEPIDRVEANVLEQYLPEWTKV